MIGAPGASRRRWWMGKGCRCSACAPLGPRNTRRGGQITALCTSEHFLALAREASRRPGGERSGPGRRILFFRTRLLQTQPSQFCVSESVELNAPCRPTRAREAASAPQQVARCLSPPIGSRAAPAPPLCSRARATPRHIVPILHSTAQHHGRHAVRRLAER